MRKRRRPRRQRTVLLPGPRGSGVARPEDAAVVGVLLAGAPRATAADLALDRLRLDGAIFLRGEYREAWAYESPTGRRSAT